jgi:hypothetical protein
MAHPDPKVQAQSNLAESARAYAASYLIRLDSSPNDPHPAERLFAELCVAAVAYASVIEDESDALMALTPPARVEAECTCESDGPMRRMTVKSIGDRVRMRFEFCCRVHSPAPWLETDHTRAGALRLAADIERSAMVTSEPGCTCDRAETISGSIGRRTAPCCPVHGHASPKPIAPKSHEERAREWLREHYLAAPALTALLDAVAAEARAEALEEAARACDDNGYGQAHVAVISTRIRALQRKDTKP